MPGAQVPEIGGFGAENVPWALGLYRSWRRSYRFSPVKHDNTEASPGNTEASPGMVW